MKILIFFLLITSSVFAAESHIEVKGMVCSLCSQGITKKFKAAGIESVFVDLDKKMVVLKNNGEILLSHEKISELIKEAGYEAVSIRDIRTKD